MVELWFSGVAFALAVKIGLEVLGAFTRPVRDDCATGLERLAVKETPGDLTFASVVSLFLLVVPILATTAKFYPTAGMRLTLTREPTPVAVAIGVGGHWVEVSTESGAPRRAVEVTLLVDDAVRYEDFLGALDDLAGGGRVVLWQTNRETPFDP